MKSKTLFFLFTMSALSAIAQNPNFQYSTIPLSANKSWMDILGIVRNNATQQIILATWSPGQSRDIRPAMKTDRPLDINYGVNYVNRSRFNDLLKDVEPISSMASAAIAPGLCSPEISEQIIRTMRVVGYDAIANYPGFNIGKSTICPRLKYVNFNNGPQSTTFITYLPLNEEKSAQTLPYYIDGGVAAYPIDNEKFIGVASDARGDTWDAYMKMKFVTFDYNGEATGIDSFNFKYLRRLEAMVPVFNTSGEKTAFFFIFGKQPAAGKKSLKDPEGDRYNIVVLNKDGKVIQSFESNHAQGFAPLEIKAVIEKGGKYYAFNRNLKSIAKVSYEQIVYDPSNNTATAEVLTIGNDIELVKPEPGFSPLREMGNYFMMIPTPSNHYYLVGQTLKYEKSATSSDMIGYYHGISILELDENFRPVRNFTAALPKSSYGAIVDLIHQNGEAIDLVITSPGAQNLVCQIRANESEGYSIKPAQSMMPLCGNWGMNYLYDASRNEIQFYYLPQRTATEAQMVVVPLKK